MECAKSAYPPRRMACVKNLLGAPAINEDDVLQRLYAAATAMAHTDMQTNKRRPLILDTANMAIMA